jgi:peptide/nickel transport system substrate-binding protein
MMASHHAWKGLQLEGMQLRPQTRRRFLQAAALLAGTAALAGCSAATPTPAPQKPAEAKPPTGAAAATATQAPAQAPAAAGAPSKAPEAAGLKSIPRNRTLITVNGGREGKFVDQELWNPYAIGATHSAAVSLFYEPLAFYSAYADKEIRFLAESYEYANDFKTLTIKTRAGVKWSDGKPFTAEDVAYTFSTLKELGPKVKWGVDVARFLDSATATNDSTVQLRFKIPAPRFFEFVTYKYDIGVYIVPKHVFSGQDWAAFKHYDPSKDWPLTTGPWKVVHAAPEQKVMDRREAWWADAAGIQKLPRVERIILLPVIGEQQTAQGVIANQLDFTYSLQPAGMPAVLKANPKVTTWTGDKPPYGYVDWWPLSLWLNNEAKPWDDKDMRWAVSYLIDRQQLAEVGWSGASSPSQVPFPMYPPLKPYYDAIKPLLEKYNTNEYSPKKGDDILTAKGYKKNAAGMYANAQGTIKLEIMGAGTSGNALGPVLPEMLRRGGIDASYSQPPDAGTRYTEGKYVGYIVGHPGSVRDIYYTLALYQSASLSVPGGLQNLSRWKNPGYDKIVDEIAVTDMNDKAKLLGLFKQAMEIWLPELPDVQLTEFHHRVPMNQTYWKNWPSQENPYVNAAFWHLTYGYLLPFLEPAQ